MTIKLLEGLTELMRWQTKLMIEIAEQLPFHNQDLIQRAIDEADDELLLEGSEPLTQEVIN